MGVGSEGGLRSRDGAGIGFRDGVLVEAEANPGLTPALNGVTKGLLFPAPGVPSFRVVIPKYRCWELVVGVPSMGLCARAKLEKGVEGSGVDPRAGVTDPEARKTGREGVWEAGTVLILSRVGSCELRCKAGICELAEAIFVCEGRTTPRRGGRKGRVGRRVP